MDPRFRGDERSEELLSEQISFYLACFARSARGRALVELNGKAGVGSHLPPPHTPLIPAKAGIHRALPSARRRPLGCSAAASLSAHSSEGWNPDRAEDRNPGPKGCPKPPATGLIRHSHVPPTRQLDSSLRWNERSLGRVWEDALIPPESCADALWIPAFAGMSGVWGGAW